MATLPNSGSSHLPARASALLTAPDGRLFVNDQRGILYTVSADGATVTPYLDLTRYVPLLSDDGERGFQTFAFHPDFATPGTAGYGKFYTAGSQSDTAATATFTPGVPGAGRDHDEVLLEWTVANPAAATFTAADAAHPFREVLRIAKPAVNHDGGYLSFNPHRRARQRGGGQSLLRHGRQRRRRRSARAGADARQRLRRDPAHQPAPACRQRSTAQCQRAVQHPGRQPVHGQPRAPERKVRGWLP